MAATRRAVEKPGVRAVRTLAPNSTSSVVFSSMATRCRGERLQESGWFGVSPGGVASMRRGEGILREASRFEAKELTNEATMSWTDERVEQLRQHWMEGKSASQIANLLGHGLTRNAVIGKVHRLGLAGRAKSPSSAARIPAVRASARARRPAIAARGRRRAADGARRDGARDRPAAMPKPSRRRSKASCCRCRSG